MIVSGNRWGQHIQTRYPRELSGIGGQHHAVMKERGGRDDQVVRPNHLALLAQGGKEIRMDARRFRCEVQHRQLCQNRLDEG